MRLDSALKNVVPNISRPKKSRHFLMKLPDNFQMREHSRPCRFHIMKNTTKYCFILYIMMSGDVHYNPGPIRYLCTKCKQPVKSNQKALQCDFCDHWTHLRCTTITVKEYHILAKCDDQYFCYFCYDC